MFDPSHFPEHPEYTSGPICLDEFVSVLGQYSDTRWNGWLCPWLDPHAVMQVAEAFKDVDETLRIAFDEDHNLILTEHIGEDEEYPDGYVEIIEPDIDGLYPLGAYSWTWSEDRLFYATDEYKAWVKERTTMWCQASNANNHSLPEDTPVFERFRLNDEVATAACAEWEQTHPEPPKEQA